MRDKSTPPVYRVNNQGETGWGTLGLSHAGIVGARSHGLHPQVFLLGFANGTQRPIGLFFGEERPCHALCPRDFHAPT